MLPIPKTTSIMAALALVVPAFAADPDAAALEKKIIGHWAPDGEALFKHYTEDNGMEEEDANALIGESSQIVVHVEKGMVHLYTEQGLLSMGYKIDAADKDKRTLTLRPDAGPNDQANARPNGQATEAIKIRIGNDQIIVKGGQTDFILKKIDEAEFEKRRKELPDRAVGP